MAIDPINGYISPMPVIPKEPLHAIKPAKKVDDQWYKSSLGSYETEIHPQQKNAVLVTVKAAETKPKEEKKDKSLISSLVNTVADAVSGFASSLWGWVTGKNANTDQKTEEGTVESLTTRPKLSKPESLRLQRLLDEQLREKDRISEINQDDIEAMKADIWNGRFTDAQLRQKIFELSNGQIKNRDEDAEFMLQEMMRKQKTLKELQAEKNKLDEQISKLGFWGGVMKIVGIGITVVVGTGLTAAAAIATFASAGTAAIPAALTVFNACGAVLGAFNALAKAIVDDKKGKLRGQSDTQRHRREDLQLFLKLNRDDLLQIFRGVMEARKLKAEEAKKMAELNQSINLVR